MSNDVLKINMLLGDYPNTLALKSGKVSSPRLSFDFDPEKTVNLRFKRLVREQAYDIGELAIATYLQAKSFGKPLILIPAVIRGKLAHAAIMYNAARGAMSPKDLEGKRAGVRAWPQTTPLWVRGILENDYGVDMSTVKWTTFEDPHCAEYQDPAGIVRAPAGKKLRQMLIDGELDAATVSEQRDAPDSKLKTLIPDAKAAGAAWYQKYKLIPINHMLCVTESFLREHPSAVEEVFRLVAESKKAAGLPPANGVDQFPLGVEAIRPALAMAIKYAYQQKLIPREFAVDELFNDFTRALGK